MEEHAVIVAFDYSADDLAPLSELSGQLADAITSAGVGEFDGNEMAVGLRDGTLYMYGPDADELFAVARPFLAAAPCLRNVRARLRYGPPEDGVRETVVRIGS